MVLISIFEKWYYSDIYMYIAHMVREVRKVFIDAHKHIPMENNVQV